MKKTILFDLDGTLIDSTSAILDGFDAAFRANGEPLPDHNKIKSLIGYPLDIMFMRLGVYEGRVQEFLEAYKECYQKISVAQTVLLKFAKEAVMHASSFADIGVVTTKNSHSSQVLLEHLGVIKYLKVIIGRNDVINPKPDPEPINLALSQLGKDSMADRQNAFMVGDTPMDMLAAKAAGITGLGVLCGYGILSDLQKCTELIFENSLRAIEYIADL